MAELISTGWEFRKDWTKNNALRGESIGFIAMVAPRRSTTMIFELVRELTDGLKTNGGQEIGPGVWEPLSNDGAPDTREKQYGY